MTLGVFRLLVWCNDVYPGHSNGSSAQAIATRSKTNTYGGVIHTTCWSFFICLFDGSLLGQGAACNGFMEFGKQASRSLQAIDSLGFLVTSKIVTLFPLSLNNKFKKFSEPFQYLDHMWPHAFFSDTTQASSGYRDIWCDIDNADNWLTASWSPKVRIVQPLFASSQKYLRSVFVNIWAQNNSWSGFCHLEAFFRWNYLSIQSIRLDKTNCHSV